MYSNSILDIAEIVLSFGPITHKKLQKLCYYVYAWYYAVFNEPICNVKFEAWVHGPVSPELYYHYKNYGWDIIKRTCLRHSSLRSDFVAKIYEIYGHYEAGELEAMTHKELPWINARKGLPKCAYSDNLISDRDIIKFYAFATPEVFNWLRKQFCEMSGEQL